MDFVPTKDHVLQDFILIMDNVNNVVSIAQIVLPLINVVHVQLDLNFKKKLTALKHFLSANKFVEMEEDSIRNAMMEIPNQVMDVPVFVKSSLILFALEELLKKRVYADL